MANLVPQFALLQQPFNKSIRESPCPDPLLTWLQSKLGYT